MTTDPIRDQLAAEAKRQKLTAYAISQNCDLAEETVKRYLSGRMGLSTQNAAKIAKALGVKISLLDKSSD